MSDKEELEGKFTVVEVHTDAVPHPYCVGPKHVAHASDKFGGMLGESAIKDLENHQGPSCCVKGCSLRYEDHETKKALILQPAKDLGNEEAGKELFKIKSLLMEKGYEGVGLKPHPEYKIEGVPA